MRHDRVVRTRVVAGVVALLAGAAVGIGWWLSAGSDAPQPTARPVGLLQMNLCGALGCYGEGVPNRLEIVGYAAATINEARPDIVMLNEVCFDQIESILQHLRETRPMAAVTVETLATGNGCAGHGYGNAVLYRGQLVGERVFDSCERSAPPCLSNPPVSLSAEQRAMVCASVRLPRAGSPEVTACSVHLVPRGRQALGERTWDQWNDVQLRSLQRAVARGLDDGSAVVVGGDLNAGPARVMDGWPPGWTELDRQRRPTRPVPDPRRKVDYVLLSPALRAQRVELLRVEKCPSSRSAGRWCTDHLPLAGTVTIIGRTRVDHNTSD